MQNKARLIYFFAFIKFLLPFILQNSLYEPHRDEFLYLTEAHHLSWGFMEVPPLLSLLAWITNFLGNGFFWIKFWPSLFGALTFVLTGRIILSLGGRSFALLLAFLSFIFSGYLRVHFLFQPNFPEIFSYTLIAYSVIRYIQTDKNGWLYITGISAGLGMMSKYSVLFFIAAVLFGLLLTKHRKVFGNKHLYFASTIGFLIFLPNVIWQATHHFPVFFHMNELQQNQLKYISPVSFLINQFLTFLPVFFIWPSGLWFVSVTKSGKEYRFLAWAYGFVIMLLLLMHGKDYYALGLYPPLLAFGAYHFEQFTTGRFKVLRYVAILFIVASGLWIIPVLLPVMEPEKLAGLYEKTGAKNTGALKWEDQKNHPLPQDFADMLSWEEMAQKTARAYSMLNPEEKRHTLLFCDNYGQAGAVNFYAKKYKLPEAFSDNASFLYWLPDKVPVDNILLVTDDKNEMQHDFIKMFSSAMLVDSITNRYARENGSLIILLKGGNDSFNKMFIEKLEKDKAMIISGKREHRHS